MIDCVNKTMPVETLYRIFSTVPHRYDLINHIITWGLDRRWRQQAAKECLAAKPGKVLDLCCGTGDLAISLDRLAEDRIELTGIDYSQPMLDIASQKAASETSRISLIQANAASLPFADGSFDCVGISFAFRNLTYKNPQAQRHLAEILRVLRVGGRLVIVESSQPEAKLVRKIFHYYLRWFVFRLGYWLSGNQVAYYYLAESAARFYVPGELKELLITAGLRWVGYQPLCFGAAAIHVAVK